MEFMRAVVRPTVTWCLVMGQVGLALMWALGWGEAKDAAAMLGPFTMMTVTFYFKSRDELRRAESAPAAEAEDVIRPQASLLAPGAK
jgi:hypothetical protein